MQFLLFITQITFVKNDGGLIHNDQSIRMNVMHLEKVTCLIL